MGFVIVRLGCFCGLALRLWWSDAAFYVCGDCVDGLVLCASVGVLRGVFGCCVLAGWFECCAGGRIMVVYGGILCLGAGL